MFLLSLFVSAGYCSLYGVVRLKDYDNRNWNNRILTLPRRCRPRGGAIYFNAGQHDAVHRVVVLPSGEVHWTSGARSLPWLSLDGIGWFVDPKDHPLTLNEPFYHHGHHDRRPSINKQGNICVLTGTIFRRNSSDLHEKLHNEVATVPYGCRPTYGRSVFFVSQNNRTSNIFRLDVHGHGTIEIVDGKWKEDWLPLDGVRWVVKSPEWDTHRLYRQRLPSGFRPLKLSKGVKPYGRFLPPPYYAIRRQFCHVGGAIRGPVGQGVYARLPRKCRPKHRHTFNAFAGRESTIVRVDITEKGYIKWQGGNQGASYLYLPDILVPRRHRATGMLLELTTGWKPRGGKFAKPRVVFENGVCTLLGSVVTHDNRNFNLSKTIAILPHECVPRKPLLVPINQHSHAMRLLISPAGELSLEGKSELSWVSLSGVKYATRARFNLRLRNGWSPFFNGWRKPRWTRRKQQVLLSGRLAVGHKRSLARLARSARPTFARAFAVPTDQGLMPLRIYQNGMVKLIDRRVKLDKLKWVSLDGIHYLTGSSGRNERGKRSQKKMEKELFSKLKTHVGSKHRPRLHSSKRKLTAWIFKSKSMDLMSKFARPAAKDKYLAPSALRVGHVCFLSGAAFGDRMTGEMAQLPRFCKPKRGFSANVQLEKSKVARVDVSIVPVYICLCISAAEMFLFIFLMHPELFRSHGVASSSGATALTKIIEWCSTVSLSLPAEPRNVTLTWLPNGRTSAEDTTRPSSRCKTTSASCKVTLPQT